MAKDKIEKESIERLDEINLLWLFKQMSLGNLFRGLAYFFKIFNGIKNCFKETCMQSEETQAAEEKKQSSGKCSGKNRLKE